MIKLKVISVVFLTIVLLFLVGSCVGLDSKQAEDSSFTDSQLENAVSKGTTSEDSTHESEMPDKETTIPDHLSVIEPSETDALVFGETTFPQEGADATSPETAPSQNTLPLESQRETSPLEDGETERDSQ